MLRNVSLPSLLLECHSLMARNGYTHVFSFATYGGWDRCGRLDKFRGTTTQLNESSQNRNGELSQQRRQQPKSGQRQSTLNVELTTERDSQLLRTARGGRVHQQKERAQETTQLCGFAKGLGGRRRKQTGKKVNSHGSNWKTENSKGMLAAS
jgi:hypothetical protein